MSVHTYGQVAVKKNHNLTQHGYNSVLMPTTQTNNNSTYISSTAIKATDLYNTTSYFCWLDNNDPSTGGNTFPMIPLKYPLGSDGGNGQSGAECSFGAFFPQYGSTTTVSAPVNRWKCCVLGFDTRFSYTERVTGMPNIVPYYSRSTVTLPAMATGYGADIDVTVPSGLYVTGIWLERIGTTGVWWPPMVCVKPGYPTMPTTSTTLKVYCCHPGEFNTAASVLRLVVVGFTGPANYFTSYDLNCDAMTGAGSAPNTTATFASTFRLLGAYQVGKNSGNYYARPWGIYTLTSNGPFVTSARVVVANPALVCNQLRSVAAGDLATRFVGIVC